MYNILVTGANGQLGKTIEELYSNNDEGFKFTFTSKKILDITNKVEVAKIFSEHEFDYCINCAAYTNVEQAEKTPNIAYLVNAGGVKNLAESCKRHSVVLIHISTDYVFDGEKNIPYTVKDETNPINEYGKSKLLGEEYIIDMLEDYFIIRTSWLYSKKYGNNFYRNILKKVKTEKKLTITTEQKGCPTNSVNLSKYLINLILTKEQFYGIKHFCDEKVMTWYDFAEQILIDNDLFTKIELKKTEKYITFAKRPKFSVLSKTCFKLVKNK